MFHFDHSFGYKQQPNSGFPVMISGILLMLFGFLILLVPEILVALISSVFFIIGSAALFFGWQIRKLNRRAQQIRIDIF